jgi:hypothetical protein
VPIARVQEHHFDPAEASADDVVAASHVHEEVTRVCAEVDRVCEAVDVVCDELEKR